AWATNLVSRLPQRSVVALAAPVAGPELPLQIMGRTVSAVFPIPPIALQLRTGAAILRYADELFFGILADYDAVADADELARGIEAAVRRLLVRSKRPRRSGRDRHGLALVVNV
ncbi:MAG: WS/DGAT domain-containing protein, partial [Mycolicibacter sinensis]